MGHPEHDSGLPAAIRTAAHYQGYLALRVLVVRTAIYTSAALIPTLLAIALPLWHWARPRNAS